MYDSNAVELFAFSYQAVISSPLPQTAALWDIQTHTIFKWTIVL